MLARSVGLQAILPSQAKHSRVAPLPLTLARPIIPSNRNLFDTDIIKSFNIIVRSFSSPSSYSKSPKISKKEKKSSTGGNQSTTTGKQRILSTSTTAAATLLGGTAAYATMSSQENNAESVTKESKGEQETKVVLVSAAFQIPHPEKKHKGGEDTLFVSSSGSVVGVFDGVGGWANVGVDPREYALKLSQGAQEATDKHNLDEPLDVLRYAHRYSHKVTGSSTACIVALHGNVLDSANVGDSGFMVVRPSTSSNGKIEVQLIYKSEELQHSFNMPYQLGPQSQDSPDDAALYSMPVQAGDLIILGTDGLFDNIDEHQIANIVSRHINDSTNEGGVQIDKLSQQICKEAFDISQSRRAVTPFGRHASLYGYKYTGGKPDDITVLISKVTPASEVTVKKQVPKEPTKVESAASNTQKSKPEQSSILQRFFGFRPMILSPAKL